MSRLNDSQYPPSPPPWPLQHEHDGEKKAAPYSVSVQPVRDSQHEHGEEANLRSTDWQPGFLSRFPWLGFGALFVVLLCVGAAVAVLFVSDGKSQSVWSRKIQPSVILSGLNNVSNLCFSLAIANGVTIAWWRKALKGATIEDLHKSWSFSSSVKEAVLAGKGFNLIALAALTAKFTIIDGMLMQDATTTYVGQDKPVSTNVTGWANTTFPITGQTQAYTQTANRMEWTTGKQLLVWDQHQSDLPLTAFKYCEGLCFFQVPAAGFEYDCHSTSTPMSITYSGGTSITFNIQNSTGPNASQNSSSGDLFKIAFSTHYAGQTRNTKRQYQSSTYDYSFMTMDLTYSQLATKPDRDSNGTTIGSCAGTYFKTSCNLRPSVINYPVMVQNYSVGTRQVQGVFVGVTEESYFGQSIPTTLFDPTAKLQEGYEFVRYQDNVDHLDYPDGPGQGTALSGLELAFNAQFGGDFTVRYGPEGFAPETTGSTPDWVLQPSTSVCDYVFDNPLLPSRSDTNHPQSVIASINQMLFAISTNAMVNLTESTTVPWQTFSGKLYRDNVHYQTRWAYAAGAIASTLFCVLCVLPVYYGYWQLGRKVSLGPFEIAHAFRSPMTAQASNGGIEDVIKQVGYREVQYGHIVAGDAQGVLGVAEPQYVARIDGAKPKKERSATQ